MKRIYLLLFALSIAFQSKSQSIPSIVAEISLDSLVKSVRELSGEDSAVIAGNKVRIKHRVSKRGNDLAADYIRHRLEAYGLQTEFQDYRNGGRNIIATLPGKTNPDSIFIIGGHYDAVADYCADDNASGTAVVLEAARIFSQYCFDNTIKFALWDEEERGLIGSRHYSDSAFARGDHIMGVLNFDMMGWDGDSDQVFDIHLNNIPRSIELKDSLLTMLDSLKLGLVPQIFNPGTTRSDHASFWRNGWGAIFFGESVLGGDPNPEYHKATDRIHLFNMDYYNKLAKLSIAASAQWAGIIQAEEVYDTIRTCYDLNWYGNIYSESGTYIDTSKNVNGCDSIHNLNLTIIDIDDSVTRNDRLLTAIDSTASYQWIDCNNSFTVLFPDTNQSYLVHRDGSFAVILHKEHCTDTSDCFELLISGIDEIFNQAEWLVYPNPNYSGKFSIVHPALNSTSDINYYLMDALGRNVNVKIEYDPTTKGMQMDATNLSKGVYYLILEIGKSKEIRKLILSY